MNKAEFIDYIKEKTQDLSDDEQEQQLSFYSEMMDDMIEDGMSEEEAADKLAADNFTVSNEAAEEGNDTFSAASGSETESGNENRIIYIRSDIPDVLIKSSPDGTFHVDYDSEHCTLRKDDSGNMFRISITSNQVHQNSGTGLFRFFKIRSSVIDILPAVIYLPERSFRSAYIDTGSGNAEIDYSFSRIIRVTSFSGDVRVQTSSEIKTLDLESKTGDLELVSPLVKSDSMTMCTTSGNITCHAEVTADQLRLKTVSGDLELSEIKSDTAQLHTVSGNIECSKMNISRQLTMKSVSGDLQISNFSSALSQISTVSGDVEAALSQPASCRLKTTSGNIKAPGVQESNNVLEITTVSGDITIRSC